MCSRKDSRSAGRLGRQAGRPAREAIGIHAVVLRAAALAVVLGSAATLGAVGRASAAESRHAPVAEPAQRPDAAVDVLDYALALDLYSKASRFRARADITLRVQRDGTEGVHLDLVGLTVDSVAVNGRPADFRREADGLRVALPTAAAAGDTLVISVVYHGAPRDGLIFGRDAYGRPSVFADNWPNRARHWFPSLDHPSDKATVRFDVAAPADWRVVANGRLMGTDAEAWPPGLDAPPEASGADRQVTTWIADDPIPVYTMVVGAAPMAVRELGALGCDPDTRRCVQVTQWTYPEDAEPAARLFRRAPRMLALYDSLVGPYPYEKLALVQSTTRYGGMENSSAIFFAENLVRRGGDDVIVAHEIAHQWFGDAVTEAEWSHLWLSEGFATYFASLFYELVDGESVAARLRAQAEARYLASHGDVRHPVIDELPENLFRLLNANNYQKGAWVLHMLRQVVGDDAFFAGMRRFYDGHAGGTALTADFRAAMEAASGQELDGFFQQWLRRPGYPQVEVAASYNKEDGTLDLRIAQVQEWPPFRFPLDVMVEGAGYSLERTLRVEERESQVSLPLPGPPQAIRVDPRNELLGPVRLIGGAEVGGGEAR